MKALSEPLLLVNRDQVHLCPYCLLRESFCEIRFEVTVPTTPRIVWSQRF
jgi:hypothetical protein